MAYIIIGTSTTLVRFGGLGPLSFDAALTELKVLFPEARWSAAENGWLITNRMLSQVMRFVYTAFPTERVIVETVAPPSPSVLC